MRGIWVILTFTVMPWLAGCSGWQGLARQHDLQQAVVYGEAFQHRLFWNPAAQQRRASTTPAVWHLYIEGDGRAVTPAGRPSLDPTPRSPVLLPALGADRHPALFVGRPCYFDTGDPACNPAWWTLHRYSDAVLSSLLAAALAHLPPGDPVILIGHSGGATLAMLLAARLPQTCAVITLAGNLDVGRWVAFHGYTPLPDTLDPARAPPLSPSITQWHLAGAADTEILPEWIQAVSKAQPDAHYGSIAGAGHLSPWQAMLLAGLQATQPGSLLQQALDNSHAECGKVTGERPHMGIY